MKNKIVIILLTCTVSLSAQSLFDNAVSGSENKSQTYELNGFIRGVIFCGKAADQDKFDTISSLGETALKLRIRKGSLGNAFAEIRFRQGFEFGENISEINLREAWVSTHTGKFDFKIGEQIVVWGRADGFNPTNNITPQNMLVRSSEEDDRRQNNFLVRGFYNLKNLRIEAVWVPVYRSSALPADLLPLPANINISGLTTPYPALENSSIGFKADLSLAAAGASISYFNGFSLMPGLSGTFNGTNIDIALIPYKVDIVGADFSTALGSFGLRGEFAFRNPKDDYKAVEYIPNPDLQYILGIEKNIGSFSLILQYIGRRVIDFYELTPPSNPLEIPAYELKKKNRMIASHLYETSHAFSFRPALNLLNETLTAEFSGMYNITTEELLLRPKLVYSITDAFAFTAGAEIYSGPEETLFGVMDDVLSSVFAELKASF